MASGDGASQAGFAVAFPADNGNKLKLADYFQQQQNMQANRDAAKAQAIQVHKDALAKYYGDQFDPSKFDTKTALNDQIDTYLSKGHQAVSDAIQSGQDGGDLERTMQQAITPALQLYQKGSLIKANIDKTAAALKDDKGIDTDALSKVATLQALYNKNPDGTYTIKSPQDLAQVDPEHDYSKDILNNNPELVSKAGVDVEGNLAKFKPSSVKSTGSYYSSPGVKVKGQHEATYLTGVQQYNKDANGVDQITTSDTPINTTDANGNPVTIHQVPDEVVNQFQQTVGGKAALDVATKKYAQTNGLPNAQPGTQVFEQMKKAMLYDMIDKTAPKHISQTQDVTTAPVVIKQELGIPTHNPAWDSNTQVNQTPPSFSKISDAKVYVNSGGIGLTVPVGTVQDGKVSGDAVPMGSAEAKIKMSDLPDAYVAAANKFDTKNDITGDKGDDRKKTPTGFVTVKLYDKKIVGIKTDKGNWFSTDDLGSVQDKELNSTLPKNQQVHPPGTQVTTTKTKIDW